MPADDRADTADLLEESQAEDLTVVNDDADDDFADLYDEPGDVHDVEDLRRLAQ